MSACKQEDRPQGASAIGQDHPWAQQVRQGSFSLPQPSRNKEWASEAFGKWKTHKSLQAAACSLNRQLPGFNLQLRFNLLSGEEESVWLSWQHKIAQNCLVSKVGKGGEQSQAFSPYGDVLGAGVGSTAEHLHLPPPAPGLRA